MVFDGWEGRQPDICHGRQFGSTQDHDRPQERTPTGLAAFARQTHGKGNVSLLKA